MADTDPVTNNYESNRAVPSAEVAASQLPEYIGRHRIERLLGRGRSGAVYLAHDEQINRPVAVKVPHTKMFSLSENAKAYMGEVGKVSSLAHPHIVPVHEVGSADKFPCYIVSQYVQGVNLGSYNVARHHTSLETARIIITLAEALDVAHRKSLYHLNLRPGTIIVDSERKPWLLADDFIRAEQLAGDWWMPGNPYYLSPEQVASDEALVGPESDVYSLGVVLYEMLTGRGPYRSEGGLRLVEEILNPSIEPPSNIGAGISPVFDHICFRAMARSPREQYQSMKELVDELRIIIG